MQDKFVFFGTPEFAAIILERLIKAGWAPSVVVTNPDRPAGRKKVMTATPVKKIALTQSINVSHQYIDKGWEFGILAAYGKILPPAMLNSFPKGIIGVHPSLLPKYRGPTPIQTVILNDDEVTGVTLFLMDEKIDHGAIISNFQFLISNDDNYETLLRKLAEAGADLLIETLPKYLAGEIKPRPQAESQATYTKKFTMEEARVDLEKDPPELIWRKVRALNPEPGVWAIKDGRRLKILDATMAGGKIVLKKIQFAGEKPRYLVL